MRDKEEKGKRDGKDKDRGPKTTDGAVKKKKKSKLPSVKNKIRSVERFLSKVGTP